MSDVSPPDEGQHPPLLPLGLLLLAVALWVLGWLVAQLILAPSSQTDPAAPGIPATCAAFLQALA